MSRVDTFKSSQCVPAPYPSPPSPVSKTIDTSSGLPQTSPATRSEGLSAGEGAARQPAGGGGGGRAGKWGRTCDNICQELKPKQQRHFTCCLHIVQWGCSGLSRPLLPHPPKSPYQLFQVFANLQDQGTISAPCHPNAHPLCKMLDHQRALFMADLC